MYTSPNSYIEIIRSDILLMDGSDFTYFSWMYLNMIDFFSGTDYLLKYCLLTFGIELFLATKPLEQTLEQLLECKSCATLS